MIYHREVRRVSLQSLFTDAENKASSQKMVDKMLSNKLKENR